MALRTAGMLLVTPVEVSLCTTHTALMACCRVGLQPRLDHVGLHAAAPALDAGQAQEFGLQAQARGHLVPQAGEVAGLVHQHLVAGAEHVGTAPLPTRPCPRPDR